MQQKTMACTIVFATLLMSVILAVVPLTSAAGATTLNPATQVPGSSVSVTGTGFGALKTVGIGVGAEVTVTGEEHPIIDLGDGTLLSDSAYAISPFVNYVTGEFGRSGSSDWSAYT